MSGAMYGAVNWGMERTQSSRAMLKGVCAHIAERAGVPVWMPRLAFLIFGILHWFLAIVVYVVLNKVLCRSIGFAAPMAAPVAAPPSAVRERFGALDRRLAELEAATLQQEAGLRRAFRDLERR